MDVEQAIEHIRSNSRAILATRRADGEPAMSPVGAAVDDEGRVVIDLRHPQGPTPSAAAATSTTLG